MSPASPWACIASCCVVLALTLPTTAALAQDSTSVLQAAAVGAPALTNGPLSGYQGLFGSAGIWAPSGSVVADSGFRPYPNGFSFMNYGFSLAANQALFGQPTPLTPGAPEDVRVSLDSATMRATFGDQVCVPQTTDPVAGQCQLTQTALVVAHLADQWSANGHCFGLATIASALFDGLVLPTALDTGAVNSMTTLNPNTQRMVLRAIVAQYFSATGTRPASMADAIAQLRNQLTPGSVPTTVLIYGVSGGHALVPFAVLDRGAGIYDIGVYDSNIPNQMRAIHVNTVTNSWQYSGSINPAGPALLWDSSAATPSTMLFGSVASALIKQQCSFCTTKNDKALISFSPVASQNQGIFDGIKLLDPTGKPLDPSLHQRIPSSNPIGGALVNGPVLMVNIGVDFAIELSGATVQSLQPFTVTVVGKGSSQSVNMNALTPQSDSVVSLGATRSSVSVRASRLADVTVTQTTEEASTSYRFTGTEKFTGVQGALGVSVVQNKHIVNFRNLQHAASQMSFKLLSGYRHASVTYTSRLTDIPSGAYVQATYAGWHGTSGKPKLWLVQAGGAPVSIPVLRSK